jgi:hypothetical protein
MQETGAKPAEEPGPVHFHILWSGVSLYRHVFATAEAATRAAADAALPGENFTIQEFAKNCPRCSGGRKSY